MWKTISVLSLVTTSMIGFNHASAQGATVITMDNQDVVYASSRSSLSQARAAALNYCAREGGKGCTVIGTNAHSGFGAVAQSASRYGTSMGYATQEAANRAALNGCASQMPANESCRVTLQFFDDYRSRSTNPTGCINPATGLPMVSGYCWGVDVGGNPYGVKLH
jgi:Domain of unknown function (DUF4189)